MDKEQFEKASKEISEVLNDPVLQEKLFEKWVKRWAETAPDPKDDRRIRALPHSIVSEESVGGCLSFEEACEYAAGNVDVIGRYANHVRGCKNYCQILLNMYEEELREKNGTRHT